MKTIKIITAFSVSAFFTAIFIVLSHYHFYVDYETNMIPTKPEVARKMRDNFDINTKNKIKKYLVDNGKFRYKIQSLKDMETGSSDSLQIHFIILDNNFDFGANAGFEDYKNKLYLAFRYPNNNNYFVLDKNSNRVVISSSTINKLKAAYINNIVNNIKIKNRNTEHININMNELKNYINKIDSSDVLWGAVHPKKVVFELTEEFGSNNNTDGQLTILTNVNSNLGIRVNKISSYNANTLCPPCIIKPGAKK